MGLPICTQTNVVIPSDEYSSPDSQVFAQHSFSLILSPAEAGDSNKYFWWTCLFAPKTTLSSLPMNINRLGRQVPHTTPSTLYYLLRKLATFVYNADGVALWMSVLNPRNWFIAINTKRIGRYVLHNTLPILYYLLRNLATYMPFINEVALCKSVPISTKSFPAIDFNRTGRQVSHNTLSILYYILRRLATYIPLFSGLG